MLSALLLLPFFRPFLCALPFARVAFEFELVHAAGEEGSHFAHARHHFHALPHAHIRERFHEDADLVELVEEMKPNVADTKKQTKNRYDIIRAMTTKNGMGYLPDEVNVIR